MERLFIKSLLVILSGVFTISAYALDFTMPAPLAPGARIAIVTPSSATDSMPVVKAMELLSAQGYEPVLSPHVYGHEYGTYAANDTIRAQELMAAFADPSIDAVMCSRGGYGMVRLLPMLDPGVFANNPKWLIGYSDISDLHALMYHAGVSSIHGPMCGHLGDEKADSLSTAYLLEMLAQPQGWAYQLPSHPYNNLGTSSGTLIGGNFITINGLSETDYDILNRPADEECILYIEEVGEKIYAVERMLMRLHQSGALAKYKGLVIGEFTEYKPSKDFETMEDMIHYWLEQWGYYDLDDFPIIFDMPSGHGDINYPLILNAPVTLTVTEEGANISWQ